MDFAAMFVKLITKMVWLQLLLLLGSRPGLPINRRFD